MSIDALMNAFFLYQRELKARDLTAVGKMCIQSHADYDQQKVEEGGGKVPFLTNELELLWWSKGLASLL